MADADDAVANSINEKVKKQFAELDEKAKTFFKEREEEIRRYDQSLRAKTEDRIREVEERVTKDVRTRVFAVATIVVVAAAGAMLLGALTATREVNNSVISLQDKIIGTQDRIQQADDALAEQTSKLSEANNAISAKMVDLEIASKKVGEVRADLTRLLGELEKARDEYRRLPAAPPQ